jgi:hypothetical protein
MTAQNSEIAIWLQQLRVQELRQTLKIILLVSCDPNPVLHGVESTSPQMDHTVTAGELFLSCLLAYEVIL